MIILEQTIWEFLLSKKVSILFSNQDQFLKTKVSKSYQVLCLIT